MDVHIKILEQMSLTELETLKNHLITERYQYWKNLSENGDESNRAYYIERMEICQRLANNIQNLIIKRSPESK